MHELEQGGPILVHCSAGIGRTGTLLTLDIVLGCIERDLKFDIHEIVTGLRKQRPGMIQTKVRQHLCLTYCSGKHLFNVYFLLNGLILDSLTALFCFMAGEQWRKYMCLCACFVQDQYLFCYTATLEALERLKQKPISRLASLISVPDASTDQIGTTAAPFAVASQHSVSSVVPATKEQLDKRISFEQEAARKGSQSGTQMETFYSATDQSGILYVTAPTSLITTGPTENKDEIQEPGNLVSSDSSANNARSSSTPQKSIPSEQVNSGLLEALTDPASLLKADEKEQADVSQSESKQVASPDPITSESNVFPSVEQALGSTASAKSAETGLTSSKSQSGTSADKDSQHHTPVPTSAYTSQDDAALFQTENNTPPLQASTVIASKSVDPSQLFQSATDQSALLYKSPLNQSLAPLHATANEISATTIPSKNAQFLPASGQVSDQSAFDSAIDQSTVDSAVDQSPTAMFSVADELVSSTVNQALAAINSDEQSVSTPQSETNVTQKSSSS